MNYVGPACYEAPMHNTNNYWKYLTVAVSNTHSRNMNVAILNDKSVMSFITVLCTLG